MTRMLALGAIGVVALVGGEVRADSPVKLSTAAMSTVCTGLTLVAHDIRDQLGCPPNLLAVAKELRACRVSYVSIPHDDDHSRRTTTLSWDNAGRLARMEGSGVSRTFDYDGARLKVIRDGSRDHTFTYGSGAVVVDNRMSDGIGLRSRKRFVMKGNEVERIENTLENYAPEVISLVRRGGRVVEAATPRGKATIEWDARGRPSRWRLDGGEFTFSYDERDRLTRANVRWPSSSERDVSYYHIEYDCTR